MLWHAAFFRNAATTSGSASLWRSASAQTRERRTGRGALRRRRDLPYSSSLFRESCEPDGLRGGSSSWRMMHSGQSAQRPLHNKFLRWAFPETCNKQEQISLFSSVLFVFLLESELCLGALQRPKPGARTPPQVSRVAKTKTKQEETGVSRRNHPAENRRRKRRGREDRQNKRGREKQRWQTQE